MEKFRKVKPEVKEEIEESLYSEDGREELVENDELTPIEQAFMSGWEQADKGVEEDVILPPD